MAEIAAATYNWAVECHDTFTMGEILLRVPYFDVKRDQGFYAGIDKDFILARDWALGYHPMGLGYFSDIF